MRGAMAAVIVSILLGCVETAARADQRLDQPLRGDPPPVYPVYEMPQPHVPMTWSEQAWRSLAKFAQRPMGATAVALYDVYRAVTTGTLPL
jgi:hypothetical protein